MSAGSNKNVAFIAIVAVMIPILVAGWFAAPMFLPMYMWTKVDLKALSSTSGIPEGRLSTKFDMKVRYNPRGEGDPIPWQIMECTPAFAAGQSGAEDETNVLVRCTFISANDGMPPGTAFINSTFKDRYFKAKALRLPPGSLGFNGKRPVVIYDRMDLDKMDITSADSWQRSVSSWENDDVWPERDDGWEPPPAP